MISKKVAALTAALLMAVPFFSACSGNPEKESSGTSEVSSAPSESSKAESKSPLTYSYSEAAEINKEIPSSMVRLVQFDDIDGGAPIAVIKTTMGEIKVILYPEEAPKAVENFITHAESGYYTGLVFNKAIRNFIIEGGDPDGNGGESIFKDSAGKAEPFENEYSLNLWHFRGALSMSNNYGQDKNGSQFFIVQAPFIDDETKTAMTDIGYPEKVIDLYGDMGGTPGFDWKRTVFGMVMEESMKIVDAIARVEVEDGGEPVNSVVIEEIRISTYEEEYGYGDEEGSADGESSASSK